MKKLSKILAAHMGCDHEQADRMVLRMHERFRKRAERTGKKMHLAASPNDKMVTNALESSEESKSFDMIVALLEELLEDVELDEVEASPPKAWN
jgi:hypothetical protein